MNDITNATKNTRANSALCTYKKVNFSPQEVELFIYYVQFSESYKHSYDSNL